MDESGVKRGSHTSLQELKSWLDEIYRELIEVGGIAPDRARDVANVVRCEVQRAQRLNKSELGADKFLWGRKVIFQRPTDHQGVEEVAVTRRETV